METIGYVTEHDQAAVNKPQWWQLYQLINNRE
jgi:hypothetical protein